MRDVHTTNPQPRQGHHGGVDRGRGLKDATTPTVSPSASTPTSPRRVKIQSTAGTGCPRPSGGRTWVYSRRRTLSCLARASAWSTGGAVLGLFTPGGVQVEISFP